MPRAKRTPDAPADRLDEMLARLKLAGIRDQLDSLLDEAARSNLSTRETLAMLCEREIARKEFDGDLLDEPPGAREAEHEVDPALFAPGHQRFAGEAGIGAQIDARVGQRVGSGRQCARLGG